MPFTAGFDLTEALDLVTLSAMIEGNNTLPLPLNWKLTFDSPVLLPFDGKWQLWKNDSNRSTSYAIVVRGAVDQVGSILKDLISFLALATGSVTVGGVTVDYKFAADPKASVHVGFALGTLLLLKFPFVGILAQLAARVPAGSNIYITGHGRGAAVGTLLRSYLHYGADRPTNNYSYKTYVFAQPKPGNDQYATDFENLFCNVGLAFRVTNSLDWVPEGPFTLECPSDLNVPNPLSFQTVVQSSILTTLTALQSQASTLIFAKVKADLQGIAVALARTKVPTAVDVPFTIPVAYSLNFVNAATEIALIGTPCAGTQCNDFFFEHHATTYYALMKVNMSTTIPVPGFANAATPYNTAFGFSNLKAVTTATASTAYGYKALSALTSGASNTAVGSNALKAVATASHNTAVGDSALAASTAGTNTAVGSSALLSNTSGFGNVAVGAFTLQLNTSGSDNVAIGYNTLVHNNANFNIGIGYEALLVTTMGSANIAIGNNTLATNVTGSYNIAIGSSALNASTSGPNVAIGASALNACTTGGSNVAIGNSSLLSLTTGTVNIAIGLTAMNDAVTPTYCVAVGQDAMYYGTAPSYSVAIGQNALINNNAAYNTGVGVNVGEGTTTGIGNTYVGYGACNANTTGTHNSCLGFQAIYNLNGGNFNTAIGSGTGPSLVTGSNNTILGAQVSRLASDLTGAIILATGDGNIWLDYNNTTSGAWNAAAPVITKGYTVSTLPAASTVLKGARAYVTDATTPTFLGRLVGGGSVNCPVFCNGKAWVAG